MSIVPDVGHLSWAIDQRAKIQHTLLALYAFAEKVPAEEMTAVEEAVFNSLISASFALWRAVFLAERPITDESLRKAQTQFLATVISTNAVTFTDDRNNSPWSLDFYMSAASLHIHSVSELVDLDDPHFDPGEVTMRIVYFMDQTVRNSRRKWEGLHAAVRILFNRVLPTEVKLVVDDPLEYDHFL